LVCQTKLAKEVKFVEFQMVRNVKKRGRKRFSKTKMRKNDEKWRKLGVWEEGSERLREGLSGAGGENEEMREHGCLKTWSRVYWAISIDRSNSPPFSFFF